MRELNDAIVLLMWFLLCTLTVELAPNPAVAPGPGRNRTQRDVTCQDSLEYLHADVCCLSCPAGTYVEQHCTRASSKGLCKPCAFDTFTEHNNGLTKCFQCTSCRSDQERVEHCTSTQNTQCQCKQGLYCLPDQACEVCKTCSKCKEDEEVAESCTSSSNTVCTKRGTASVRLSAGVAIATVLIIVVLVVVVSFLYWKTSLASRSTVVSSCSRDFLKMCTGGSRGSSEATQNGLNNVTQMQPFLPSTPGNLENGKLRRLVPLNGEESLKKSFDLFEEVDILYHNRFFRYVGLSDNAIRNAESSSTEDKVYELLKIWLEKEGLKADFNSLIEALLHLDQRLSAENIIARAISNGYFKYEEEIC